jgi:hypothetical protein
MPAVSAFSVSVFSVSVWLFVASAIVSLAAASPSTSAPSSRRRGRGHVLQGRLVDVGDAWRALLLGAPPVLL